MLNTAAFQKNVRSIVVDEAHLVDDWLVLLFLFFSSYCLSSDDLIGSNNQGNMTLQTKGIT